MNDEPPDLLVRTAPAQLAPHGLDLVHAFDVADYNRAIAEHPKLSSLPTFGRTRALGLLIANTQALWPIFLTAYRTRPDLQAAADPLDDYVMQGVQAFAAGLSYRTEVRGAHEHGPRLVSMLHLADVSGFAQRGPAHLAAHPRLGPWFALRAVVVVDEAPPPNPSASVRVCEGCEAPCKTEMEAALGQLTDTTDAGLAQAWQAWVRVRDACPVGRDHRYSESQIRYHYTKDRSVLERKKDS